MAVRCLAEQRKVGVKNKENETACFIEIEGLLNSPKLISDLPGLGVRAPQSQGRELGEDGGEQVRGR